MSTPRFATTTEAVTAFRAGGKRWVHVDGHLVDLLTYVEPRRVAVMREDPEPERCEVLPELAVPDVECCRACGRPLIGDAGP